MQGVSDDVSPAAAESTDPPQSTGCGCFGGLGKFLVLAVLVGLGLYACSSMVGPDACERARDIRVQWERATDPDELVRLASEYTQQQRACLDG